MPQADLSGLTVPIFTAVFGMGWASCYAILVKPLQGRVTDLERRMLTIEEAKANRIAALEAVLMPQVPPTPPTH